MGQITEFPTDASGYIYNRYARHREGASVTTVKGQYVEVLPVRVGIKEYSRNEICKATGISRAHVTRIFNGKRKPSLSTCIALASYFGVSLETLLGVVLPVNIRRSRPTLVNAPKKRKVA